MRTASILSLFWLALGCACVEGPADQLAREQAFAESMKGAVLDGHFTVARVDGEPSEEAAEDEPGRLRSDRYEIEKAVKLAGDVWTFHARIKFGDQDVSLPVPVKLAWAGDTPVVSVTDVGLPGLGSYTARVLFYEDSYAGTWSGGSYAGSMFGRLERAE